MATKRRYKRRTYRKKKRTQKRRRVGGMRWPFSSDNKNVKTIKPSILRFAKATDTATRETNTNNSDQVKRPVLSECVIASIEYDSCKENGICKDKTLDQLETDKNIKCASNYKI